MQRFDMAVEAGIHIDEVDGDAEIQTNYAESLEKLSTESPMKNTAITA